MARDGVTQIYTATPGAGQGAAMRAWMAANLVEPTVGAVYTLGSGSTERNYWTLQYSNGMEIMFSSADGINMYRDDLNLETETRHGNWRQAITMVFSPDGGLEAALAAGEDPDTASFYTYLDGIPVRPVSRPVHLSYWRQGGPAVTIRFIEDDTGNCLIMQSSEATIANSFGGTVIFASDFYKSYPSAGSPFFSQAGVGFCQHNNNSSPKTMNIVTFVAWETGGSNARREKRPGSNTPHTTHAGLDGPASGSYSSPWYTHELPVFFDEDGPGEACIVNPNYMRFAGVNLHSAQAFKLIYGDSTDWQFINLVQRYALPWDNAESAPT